MLPDLWSSGALEQAPKRPVRFRQVDRVGRGRPFAVPLLARPWRGPGSAPGRPRRLPRGSPRATSRRASRPSRPRTEVTSKAGLRTSRSRRSSQRRPRCGGPACSISTPRSPLMPIRPLQPSVTSTRPVFTLPLAPLLRAAAGAEAVGSREGCGGGSGGGGQGGQGRGESGGKGGRQGGQGAGEGCGDGDRDRDRDRDGDRDGSRQRQ
mmetsp:Transcript_11354/g.30046  ORF Transcript_11354/g.30046 Transcript_11354/m.30046 type:complete len:208 (+) Transcript_11354:390-1013(+)